MFPDIGKSSSGQYWHHWLMSGLWSTTYCPSNCKCQQSSRSHTDFYWPVYLAYQFFIFCQKKHLKQSFCYNVLLTHNHL